MSEGPNRQAQKFNAVALGLVVGFVGFLSAGMPLQNNVMNDPTVGVIGGVLLLVALFAGK